VNIRSKVVTLLLLFGFLAGPAAAVSRCWSNVFGNSEHCSPGCPMMAKMPVAPHLAQAEAQAPACCRMSPARTVPSSETATPANNSRAALANVQIATVAPPVSAVVRTSDEDPPPLLVRSQAVLCTFLI
jgi:hypothetical protein